MACCTTCLGNTYKLLCLFVFILSANIMKTYGQSSVLDVLQTPEAYLIQADLGLLQQFSEMKGSLSVQLAKLNYPGDIETSNGFSILGLEANPVIFETVDAEVKNKNDYFWYAERRIGAETINSDYMMLISGDSVTVGEIVLSGRQYLLYKLNEEYHVLVETEDLPMTRHTDWISQMNSYETNCTMTSESCQIDLLFFYLPDTYLQIFNPPTQSAFLIVGQLRAALLRSKVKHTIKLVGVELFEDPGWVNQTDAEKELSRLDIVFANKFSLPSQVRDRINPDLIFVLSSGLAYPDPAISSPYAAGAARYHATSNADNFGISGLPYATNASYTAVHEIGHLLSANHENEPATIPANAHEFTFGSKAIQTVMHSNSQTPILQFSNPDVLYFLAPTGTVERNNACVVQKNGCDIAQIGTADDCIVLIVALRDCIGNLGLVGRYVNPSTGTICSQGDLIRFEVSIDGFNYTSLGINSIHIPVITSIPSTYQGIVYIRATVFVSLVPTGVAIQRVYHPCPIPISDSRSNLKESWVYPNPTRSLISFAETFETDGQLEIIKLDGQLLKSINYKANAQATLNVADLPEGLYFIRFTGQSKNIVHAFTKID